MVANVINICIVPLGMKNMSLTKNITNDNLGCTILLRPMFMKTNLITLMTSSSKTEVGYNHTERLKCPLLIFCKHLSLVVNKSGQKTMKTAIEIFLAFQMF